MAFQHLTMDFIEGLSKSEGKDTILVVVDKLTKYTHFIPLSHPFTMVQLFLDNIFKLHGLPIVIITDRDKIFTSQLWQELFKSLNVKLKVSSAYHPQIDDQSERVNQCLENYLRCLTFQNQKKWKSHLSIAEWWYNTSLHSTLKTTPFQALYGFSPPMITENLLPDSVGAEARDMLLVRQTALQNIKANLKVAQERMKGMLIRRELKEPSKWATWPT
jgi:hypothetical protein